MTQTNILPLESFRSHGLSSSVFPSGVGERIGPSALLGTLLLLPLLLGLTARPVRGDDFSRDLQIGALQITLPPLENPERLDKKRPGCKALIGGNLGKARVEILINTRGGSYSEPEDATDAVLRKLRPAEDRKGQYRYAFRDLLSGPFGTVPFASLCIGPPTFRPPVPSRNDVGGEIFVLGGVLPSEIYMIEVYTGPELTEPHRKVILDFLKTGITAECEQLDLSWPAEEILERWTESVQNPKTRNGMNKPIRTKHYIIMTNSSAGTLFGRKMEEAYRTVQKIFPFPEVKERKLLPVFLFRLRDEYLDFSVKTSGMTKEAAGQSKGHATSDYYATYYDSPKDPVHIHEATHQIFQNRLRLWGGGSWFQEGVAEYVSSSKNERKAFAKRAAKDDKYIPFRNFVTIPSIISNPYMDGGRSYLQAASLIEFLRDGKTHRDKFPRFLEEVGKLPRSKLDEIEAAVTKIYGTDLEGLEKEWVKFWVRR